MLQIYFLTYSIDMKKYTLTKWNIFPRHQGAHVARLMMFNGPKLLQFKGPCLISDGN